MESADRERIRGLERRVEQSERAVRRLQFSIMGLGLVTVLVWAAPAVSQGGARKVTRVSAPFQVVDTSGRLLMMVETGKPGPFLQLYDSAGGPSVVLGMGERGGGSLQVYERAGKPGVSLAAAPGGGGSLTVLDAGQKPGVTLAAGAKGGGSLRVLDGGGKVLLARP